MSTTILEEPGNPGVPSTSPNRKGRTMSNGAASMARRLSGSTMQTTTTSSFKDKIRTALSPRRGSEEVMSQSRDNSRGREQIVSTGRGGAGNFIRSASRDAKLGVDETVHAGGERGRALSPASRSQDRVTHSGRGGAGNVRSPSQNPADRLRKEQEEELEDRLVMERRGRERAADLPFSTGRGGAGNIGGSKSRSRSRADAKDRAKLGVPAADLEAPKSRESSTFRAGGRGGYGNIHQAVPMTAEEKTLADAEAKLDADIMARHREASANGVHSAGKGGFGNIRAKDSSPNGVVDMSTLTLEEKEAYAKVHAHDKHTGFSTGKGGAGNIAMAHKSSVDGLKEDDARGRGAKHDGVVHSVLRSLSRAAGMGKNKD